MWKRQFLLAHVIAAERLWLQVYLADCYRETARVLLAAYGKVHICLVQQPCYAHAKP